MIVAALAEKQGDGVMAAGKSVRVPTVAGPLGGQASLSNSSPSIGFFKPGIPV